MTHQPNCDKNTKACAVYHAQGTPCLGIPCTCKPADLPSLIESGISEFNEFMLGGFMNGLHVPRTEKERDSFLKSFATKAHNDAIERAVEAVEEEDPSTQRVTNPAYWGNKLRAKLSALKEKEV